MISSYKKNTEGRYHRHNRLDWSAEQGARRDCFHDAAWVEYLAPPRVPEGAVHLIIGDSLVRVLTRIQSHWQTGILSFAGAATPQMLATLDMLGMTKVYTVTLMIGTNDVSRGEARKIMRLYDKMSCLLEELRIQMDPILLTVCTVPYNMMFDQHALEMNEKVRNLNKVIRDIHRKSVLPVRLLNVAERMEKEGFPEDTSNDGIHFDKPRGAEWLNDVFQEHINTLESDLLETAQFTLGPPPNPPFLASRALSGRLGTRVDARDGSRSIQTRLQSATPMESEEVMSSTPPGSAMSSVVVAESKREKRSMETARLRYPEKVKELDLESLECRRELAETLGIERVSHEDLNRHHCVDWLKAHEAHFSRTKLMETTDLTGIPTKAIMGPINYRPLKLLGSLGLITEPPKHRTSIARVRLATPAQLKVVDKLLNPGSMELPDAAYEGSKLAEDPRYGKPCGSTQLAKTLAVYDRADPAAARVVIVAGSDFEGTSPKLFWPETLIYSLPGAELNQMLTLVVAIKSEMPCEPELLLFAGMNDHLHAVGLLEQLKGDENPPSRKIWEAIQVLFAAMNEVQENVVSRFGSKTKVVFTTSPGYANMPPALQFVYAVLILIAEGNEWRILMAAPNRELEPSNLRLRKSELAAAWADISHALRGFYGLADILIVLDEVLLLEISNFARQLKFNPVIRDDHPAISQLTARLWFRSMDVKITNSTSKSRVPSNERRNVAETEKQLESMKYRLTQENGWWPFLTPRLENATNKTREEAPPLVKQVWSFLEKQLELAETRDMTVARFVSAANEVTIGGFWREHAKGELRTRRDYEVLKFLSPCWEKEFTAGMFGTTATIFGAFVQEILGMPISLLLALYLVYPRYLFNMGPAYMFSRGVETLRVDGYLALLLLTHGELVSFHRLMEYGEPLSMGRVHSSIETSSYKCAAGLKTLLVQYLMMQNRHMTGEDENPTSREEWKKTNRGMPLLTDLCLAMRSDPMGIIRGLEDVVTCIYGPAVTYAFPDPLVTTYRHSVTHLSLISILDGTALNWCQQEVLRGRMSNTVLFGKVKDAELIVCNFRGQMQCRMGGKREGPIEMYPKFWNLNPLTADGREILRIPAWKECFALVKRELETIMEKEILPATMPEFPIVRRMTLGMNSPLVFPSIMARMTTEEMQKDFTDGWDPLFIGYTAAVYFHTSEAKVNSWTTRAKKMRGSQPPGYEVRKVLRALEQEGLENMLPIWDDGRMIVMEGHVALVDDMKFATRKYRAPYGLEQVEVRQEGKELDAAGQLHVALTEYKKLDPTTPSPLSVDTPGDKRSGPVEDRFKKILERRRHESEEESMDETLSEAGEDMEVGNTPEPGPSGEELTTQELLKDLSEEIWVDTATPPLNPSPRKNLELPLANETFNMGMILLSSEERERNTFDGNRDIFLGSLKNDAWQEFLEEFNQEVGSETTMDKFKEELWDTVVRFGEPLLIGTGLDEKARKELLSKLVELRNSRSKTREEKCEDSSTLKQKTVDKRVDGIKRDKVGTSNIIKSTNILKARAGGRQELEGLDREVESVMIATTPSSRNVKTRKRKREVEGLGSPSVDAVSEGNLRETAPMVLARCKTAAYKNSSELRRPLEVEREIETSTSSTSEEDFKPQKINVKRGSTNGQTWEVDIGKEWISKAHQNMCDGNGLLTTNLGVVWKLLRPSWCPHPHASLIEETTERVRLAPTEDEDLAKLSVLHKLISPQMQEPSEKTNNPGSAKKLEPGSCLDSTCGNGEHTCDGRSCVRILSFQKEDLVTWFEDITERERSEVQIVAECYARTTVNIATALGFFSRMCSLQSLERLESEHHWVTALSVESWPGVLQVTQKHIRSWKVGLETEMGFPMSEAYGLPLNAKSLIGSMMANLCGSHYPLHMVMVEASSQRVLVDKAFSVPKCVRLARISHHSHKLLRKIRGTVPKELRDDLSEIWGEELLKLERENTSDHERQNVIGKPVGSAPNLEDNDTMHEKMTELEPLLEASWERYLRSIEITHGECPCHCLAQTVWYPDHKNLCLVWDMEEIQSIGLPDHRQKVTILVVSTMLALRWIEENITKYREAGTPTAESIYAIDYSRRLELFETACKVFAIPTEVRHVWSRLRYFPWFRATLTSWLYMTTKDHMRKHQKEYRQFQAEIGPEAFKRPLLTHRNAITTGWKRVGKMSRDNTKARELILEEDLAKNVSLSLHNSFCLNRESRVKALPNQAKRLQEQREWMRSYEQLKAWEEIVISSDDEEELLRQFAVSSTSGCSTSKAKSAR